MNDSSPSWREYESTFAETELEPPESMMGKQMSDQMPKGETSFQTKIEDWN